MSSVRIIHRSFPTGGLTGCSKGLMACGYRDSKLSTRIPEAVWWENQKVVMSQPHEKIIVVDQDLGFSVGGIVLVPCIDAQVGECLTAFHQFLHKDYRGIPGLWRKVIRMAEQAASSGGYQFLVWSHRDETRGRYFVTYKEVQKWVQ